MVFVINFGHQTFIWDSEASIKAHVHCIIVGFSYHRDSKTVLYSAAGTGKLVSNINQYLTEGPTVIVESRSVPLCNVPPIRFGSMPRDGGGFILSEEEKEELIKKEPTAAKWIHPYLGAEEFLKNKKRYCLWLLFRTHFSLGSEITGLTALSPFGLSFSSTSRLCLLPNPFLLYPTL